MGPQAESWSPLYTIQCLALPCPSLITVISKYFSVVLWFADTKILSHCLLSQASGRCYIYYMINSSMSHLQSIYWATAWQTSYKNVPQFMWNFFMVVCITLTWMCDEKLMGCPHLATLKPHTMYPCMGLPSCIGLKVLGWVFLLPGKFKPILLAPTPPYIQPRKSEDWEPIAQDTSI